MGSPQQKRSRSLEKKPTSQQKLSRMRYAKYATQRSFSNPKLRDVLKHQIKQQEREVKVNLRNFRPVKLNLEPEGDQGHQRRMDLRNNIIKNLRARLHN